MSAQITSSASSTSASSVEGGGESSAPSAAAAPPPGAAGRGSFMPPVSEILGGAGVIQRKASDPGAQAESILSGGSRAESAMSSLPSGGGSALDSGVAGGVESATGQSLGDVRVHGDSASSAAADSIGARAFTVGQNIYLGSGQSSGDQSLMSHEAAHTIQQSGGGGAPQAKMSVSQPGDALEQEADQVASAAMSGGTATVSVGAAAGAVQRDAVSDFEDKMSYGAFDWAITDSEATEAFDLLAGMDQPTLIASLARISQTAKSRLLDNLPAAVKARPAFARVLCAMGPAAVQPYIESLLSYGVFDWAVTDGDIRTVLTIFHTLEMEQAAELFGKMTGKFKARFISNMPKGTEMSAPMKKALFHIVNGAVTVEQARELFEVRFNHPVVDQPPDPSAAAGAPATAVWTLDTIRQVWKQLDGLPDQDVSGIQIWQAFQALNTSGGFYSFTHIEIGVNATPEKMAHTVRHEIGHGVHAALKAVVDAWLQGSVDFWYTDFATWIDELGGYPAKYTHPTDGEKDFDAAAKAAVLALVEGYTGNTSWDPTKASPETGADDVQTAQWNAMGEPLKNACKQSKSYWYSNWSNFQQAGGRRYFLNHWYHAPYRFGATAASAITATGDNYSAMSEQELFANCYAEYFHDPAGVDDHSKWGGGLPSSVKDFFETCIVGRHPYEEFTKAQARKNT